MKPVLDATAGNRMIWTNKNPPNVVFLDKERNLGVPPNIFADNRYLPFRDNCFSCVIFDPPYSCSLPPWWDNPTPKRKPKGNTSSWYGRFKNPRDMVISLHKAQKEFQRVSNRLCFKWGEMEKTFFQIASIFTGTGWKIIQQKEHRGKYKVGKVKTWWITMTLEVER